MIKKQDELEDSYAEHGQDFISYHEKEGALKALEIVNMGSKYHVETEWQPVKKTSTVCHKDGSDQLFPTLLKYVNYEGS